MDFYEAENYTSVQHNDSTADGAPSGDSNGGSALKAEFEAINKSLPWATFNRFVGNVKKYGEQISKNAKAEIEEATQDLKAIRETLQQELIVGKAAEPKEEDATSSVAVKQDGESATERLGTWFKSANLDKYAANVGKFLKEAVVIEEPEDTHEGSRGGVLFDQSTAQRQQVFLSRMERQLAEIQGDAERIASFTPPIKGEDLDAEAYADFLEDFSADDNTAEIAEQLERYPRLRETMEALVPEKLDYVSFWQRYYWLVAKLKIAEERRKRVLDRAAAASEEVGWDDEEEAEQEEEGEETAVVKATKQSEDKTAQEEDNKPVPSAVSAAKKTTKKSPRPSSEESYDLVSQQHSPTAKPPISSSDARPITPISTATDDPAATPRPATRAKPDDHESDDDWE
ncbi:hypothetical protein PYCC9005_003731 [Savitreella phatthalungensis]